MCIGLATGYNQKRWLVKYRKTTFDFVPEREMIIRANDYWEALRKAQCITQCPEYSIIKIHEYHDASYIIDGKEFPKSTLEHLDNLRHNFSQRS